MDDWQNGNGKLSSSEKSSWQKQGKHGTNKKKFSTVYRGQKRQHNSCPSYPTDPEDPEWLFQGVAALTPTQRKQKDDNEPGVIGVGNGGCTGITAGTVTTLICDMPNWHPDDAWSLDTTMGIIRTSLRETLVPIKGTTMGSKSPDYMPRRKRLKSGNGPDTDGQDSPMRWTGHRSDESGAAGSALAVETDQCEGGGTGYEQMNDSRLNFRSRYGPRPSTGGDDTFLTPYSNSTMTDTAVESLPTLFLAYCALDSADLAGTALDSNDQAVPARPRLNYYTLTYESPGY